jgi:glutathione S-transferase
MRTVSTTDAIKGEGLRMFIVQSMPSPWSQAAKAMMEYKGLDFVLSYWEPAGANTEISEWSGANSAPVVALNDEAPINSWLDILFLLERLNPEASLLPNKVADRARVIGMSHEICGEEGLGWNRRLSMTRIVADAGEVPQPMANMMSKYGYERMKPGVAERQIEAFRCLSETLQLNQEAGSEFFVGDSVTALDFYWAAFCNLYDPLPPEQCPMAEAGRALFGFIEPEVRAALAPNLLAHRDAMMKGFFVIPMEM